jgi:hypothetical protein
MLYSLLRVNRHFGGMCCFHLQSSAVNCLMLVSFLAYSLMQKIELTCSSEMSFVFQWTSWHYIPEDMGLHNHCRDDLKSYKTLYCCSFWYNSYMNLSVRVWVFASLVQVYILQHFGGLQLVVWEVLSIGLNMCIDKMRSPLKIGSDMCNTFAASLIKWLPHESQSHF